MNVTSTLSLPADSHAPLGKALPRPQAVIDWLIPLIVLGSACITFGILWDISWHATIGRDTFWTPAHLLIYVGGAASGLLAGVLAAAATFWRKEALRGVTVGLLGARAPLGAWVTIWGALAMLTSAPLDDWWHNTYGLDVKILSPPHALLAMGMYGVVTGAYLLAFDNTGGTPTPIIIRINVVAFVVTFLFLDKKTIILACYCCFFR